MTFARELIQSFNRGYFLGFSSLPPSKRFKSTSPLGAGGAASSAFSRLASGTAGLGTNVILIMNTRTKASSEEFPHEVRIVRASDYRLIYRQGRKIHSESFVMFGLENGRSHHRLGITVSRKVGGAVIRNRIKRLFREIFRRSAGEIPGHFDLVINAKAGSVGVSYFELRNEFMAAALKINR
jgi:ribonuclease P protein component